MKPRLDCAVLGACVMLAGAYGLANASSGSGDQTPNVVKPALADSAPQELQPLGSCSGDPTNLFYPLDGTFQLVDFFGDGCTGSGLAQGPDQHNDDDSAFVPLPFTFDLYDDLYNDCYINNNGNVTFTTFFSAFVPVGFPDPSIPPMIAPFWGDVDTGNPNNFIGDVWMKFLDSDNDSDLDTMIVIWDNVGYYNEHGDLLNTFELIMTDGTNPDIGFANNVCFIYDDMCWTTGDASGGSGGFGGTPATVGANRGNGVEFFQVGRFDHPGIDYDGPFGNNDGVSFLDFQSICFQTGTPTVNINPIAVGFPDGGQVTLDACVPDVLNLTLQFLSPEEGQVTTVTIVDVNGAQAAGLMISNAPGNPAIVVLDWTVDPPDAGSYLLQFTATDDFAPPGVTEIDLVIDVEAIGCEIEAALDIKPGSCPNPVNTGSKGVIPIGLLGSDTLDVTQVDLGSLVISRADGVGGSVGPNEGPPGPHTTLGDVGTPFDGDLCNCHELEGDGILDVNMHFKTQAVVDALQLKDLPTGTFVELCVSGVLLDGTEFSACDCIRIKNHEGGGGGHAAAVNSNIPGAWIGVSIMDDYVDGGGFTDGVFTRHYSSPVVLKLTHEPVHEGFLFGGWIVNGQIMPGSWKGKLTVEGQVDVMALWTMPYDQPVVPKKGKRGGLGDR